jgi:hypothetical protein
MSAELPFDSMQNLSSKLVLSSIARFIFFPFFLFCAAQNSQFSALVAQSDIFSWTIQFLFAVTNGALTNIAFCCAPGLVENRTHPQQVASAILNFSLYPLDYCVEASSPFPFSASLLESSNDIYVISVFYEIE